MYAKNNNGVRITAEPGVVATCPNCGNEVKAKCGDIKIRRVLAIFTIHTYPQLHLHINLQHV